MRYFGGVHELAMTTDSFAEFEQKMIAAGIARAGIDAFRSSYRSLVDGQTGLIRESEIQPVTALPGFEEIQGERDQSLLSKAVIVKLNGGLGTSMGLEGPKSLLPIKRDLTFLDLIARQVLYLRQRHGTALRFLLMNSFSTTESTLEHLKAYPELGDPRGLELMQGIVPKVDAKTLKPIAWPANPQLEWCPPGHGDLYPSLLGSGWLERLLNEGILYMFVSNSDNLGATLDLALLTYFAESGHTFLMEVAQRTEADRKGGHLASGAGGKLLLRESAQCPPEDMHAFQDVQRHQFFNTNNLWIRLDELKRVLDQHGGVVPLALIKNAKTVDPRDKTSPPVFQLETAMGAAISSFHNAGAVRVPRDRFAPVKTTSDLLVIRSDAYQVTDDWRVELDPACGGNAPIVELDSEQYKLMEQLDQKFTSIPSLRECRKLTVNGPVLFSEPCSFAGTVHVVNSTSATKTLPSGTYSDQEIAL